MRTFPHDGNLTQKSFKVTHDTTTLASTFFSHFIKSCLISSTAWPNGNGHTLLPFFNDFRHETGLCHVWSQHGINTFRPAEALLFPGRCVGGQRPCFVLLHWSESSKTTLLHHQHFFASRDWAHGDYLAASLWMVPCPCDLPCDHCAEKERSQWMVQLLGLVPGIFEFAHLDSSSYSFIWCLRLAIHHWSLGFAIFPRCCQPELFRSHSRWCVAGRSTADFHFLRLMDKILQLVQASWWFHYIIGSMIYVFFLHPEQWI